MQGHANAPRRGLSNFSPALVAKIRSELLYNLYYKLFDVVLADTDELREQALRLRYQVFCLEHDGFEDPAAHPNGMETDRFDERSEHALLIYKPKNQAIGTVRIIKPNPENWHDSFAMQQVCKSPLIHDEAYVRNACEFSRLCISRRHMDEIKKEIRSKTQIETSKIKNISFYEKPILSSIISMAPMGLIRGAFEMTTRNNFLNVFSIMEPRHIQRLENVGLVYKQIGPEIEYHGTRRPFMLNILEVYEHAIKYNNDIWNIVSNRGQNHREASMIFDRRSAVAH